jgi:hypothetical protein
LVLLVRFWLFYGPSPTVTESCPVSLFFGAPLHRLGLVSERGLLQEPVPWSPAATGGPRLAHFVSMVPSRWPPSGLPFNSPTWRGVSAGFHDDFAGNNGPRKLRRWSRRHLLQLILHLAKIAQVAGLALMVAFASDVGPAGSMRR